ncbi:MAG: iron-sulfur cluster assembly protein IscA [Endozoicomonas sp.]
MAITMTDAAARHVKDQLKKRGRGVGVRVGVRTSGCSGMAYVLEFVDQKAEDDLVFKSHDLEIHSDEKSLVYLNGTELDFVKEGLNEGFQFNNPNVASECGCGESFNV